MYDYREFCGVKEHKHGEAEYWHPVTRIHVNDDIEHRLSKLERDIDNIKNKRLNDCIEIDGLLGGTSIQSAINTAWNVHVNTKQDVKFKFNGRIVQIKRDD